MADRVVEYSSLAVPAVSTLVPSAGAETSMSSGLENRLTHIEEAASALRFSSGQSCKHNWQSSHTRLSSPRAMQPGTTTC